MTFPHGTVGWTAACDYDHTHLLFSGLFTGFLILSPLTNLHWERSGSVVECLT